MNKKDEKDFERVKKSLSQKQKQYKDLILKVERLEKEIKILEEKEEFLKLKIEKEEISEIFKIYKKSTLSLEEFIDYIQGGIEK